MSSYLGLYDCSRFEGPKIMIFLSVLSGFEAHAGKNFCDILVQLSGFEDKFGKILHIRNALGKVKTKDLLAQNF